MKRQNRPEDNPDIGFSKWHFQSNLYVINSGNKRTIEENMDKTYEMEKVQQS